MTTQPAIRQRHEIRLPTGVLGLTTGRDDGELFASCIDGGVFRVDLESGASEHIGAHESYASGVTLVNGGSALVSAGYDGVLQWHDFGGDEKNAAATSGARKIKAHDFWSWQIAVSRDGSKVASTTGQYLCGGYKYEPAPERESSVKVYGASGELLRELPHVPPVESVTFSPDGRHLAAGNLMGEVRVWDMENGELASTWTTPSFTGWGIIKGHYYTGGIFAMRFTPDGEHLLVAGMGSTRDPAAGNGRQLWQRFAWREKPARKVDETHRGESGQGLMETLEFHPSGRYFVMAGRVFKGSWNAALFDARDGKLLKALPKTGTRVTRAVFSTKGDRLYLAGATGQPRPGKSEQWGRIKVYDLARRVAAF